MLVNSKEMAIVMRHHWYVSENETCPECQATDPIRHVASGKCKSCICRTLDTLICANRLGNDPSHPDLAGEVYAMSAHQAFAWKVDSYWTHKVCSVGAHFRRPILSTGRCENCRQESLISRPSHHEPIVAPLLHRETAKALGFTHYSTGKPCRRGHTSPRYVSTGNCMDCLRLR